MFMKSIRASEWLSFWRRGTNHTSSMCCSLETMSKEGNQIDENLIEKGDGEKGV